MAIMQWTQIWAPPPTLRSGMKFTEVRLEYHQWTKVSSQDTWLVQKYQSRLQFREKFTIFWRDRQVGNASSITSLCEYAFCFFYHSIEDCQLTVGSRSVLLRILSSFERCCCGITSFPRRGLERQYCSVVDCILFVHDDPILREIYM